MAEASLEYFFRHDYGRVVAHLTRRFGVDHLEAVEDAVQDAMLRAVQDWQFGTPPRDPAAWILVVARNRMINVLRRRRNLESKLEKLPLDEGRSFATGRAADSSAADVLADSRDEFIEFLFLCCHPELKQADRIALTLSLAFGFHAREIAGAFVIPEATLAQRMVRAKRRLRARGQEAFESNAARTPERFADVLRTLYLVFNEGYHASRGDGLMRQELCFESIRMLRMILERSDLRTPEAEALLALQLLQAARFPGRLDASGEPVILEEQDRSCWDQELIAEGLEKLSAAARGDFLSEYHILATISALHDRAPTFAATDWPRITDLYRKLYEIRRTPIVGLNYAVSIAMRDGPHAGIEFLRGIPDRERLERYSFYHSAMGWLYRRNDEHDRARRHFLRARDLTDQIKIREFLDREVARLGSPVLFDLPG